MDYEIYAPDPMDEFYDEMCSAAWTRMWSDSYERDYPEESVVCNQRPCAA